MEAIADNIVLGPESAREKARRKADAGRKDESRRPVSRQVRGLQEPVSEEHARTLLPNAAARRRMAQPLAVYAGMVRELRERYKVSIRKWRSDMAGVAYELTYRDGRIKRLIAAPRPRSPVSAAIFLHEIGHHAIGFKRYSHRCIEEHYVWQWAFREMAERGIPVTARVTRYYRRSMYHYVQGAPGRGEHVPHEFLHFGCWPG